MKTVLITISLVGLSIILLSVKILFKKNGKFPESHACKFEKDRRRESVEKRK
jgi:hypothetical protein